MEGRLMQRLILALFVLSKPMRWYGTVEGADTLSLGGSLRGNQTIVSQNGTFELGFFNLNGTNNWYLGIWYAKLSTRAYVWLANRETPLKNKAGILNLSTDGQLGLFDAEGESLWSPNDTNAASEAVLLDSGNFVMLGAENISETVWESFDHPVDTWLPGMKFGQKSKLISWRNSMDPAPGIFSLEMDQSDGLQIVLRWKDSVQYWGSGAWDGKAFANIPEMSRTKSVYPVSTDNTTSGVYFMYTVPAGTYDIPRFVMDKGGAVLRYMLIDGNHWNMVWSEPRDQCEVYSLCGLYGTCNSNNIQFCSCPRGFEPRDEQAWASQEWWSSGCVRQSPLSCGANSSSVDQFIGMNVWLPDNYNYNARSYAATWMDCQKACLANCSCTAFNYMSNVCQIWTGDLMNMRNALPSNDSTVFIRVAASEIGSSSSSKGTRSKIALLVGVVAAFVIVFAILAWSFWRRYWMRLNLGYADAFPAYLGLTVGSCCERREANEVDATTSIRMFTYKELQISTRNFTQKLGSGAFGSVFRGTLPDGTLVAVKKLQVAGQGEKQFRAEINTVGNINHVNLIRLRGFCAEKSKRLLVYDYMPNGSLNTFLFRNKSTNDRKGEDWKTRFEIALGVARGLAYLHEECKERIIHCDVKPENILLDDNLCPKVGDFGLAKLVGRDFSRVLTTTRGTRGYLAPEWIAGLPITPKADVYSFGMTLLEIISGRRNLDLSVPESSKLYFPTWASTQIQKEDIMSVVDGRMVNSTDEKEVRRAAVVSMLCIQDDEAVRPSMGQVLLMLEGKTEVQTPQMPRSLFTLLDQ